MGYVVESLGKRNTSHAVMVLLPPLQSTKEQMHTIRAIDMGCHKQLAMGTCIDRIYKNMCCPSNKQAYNISPHGKDRIQVTIMCQY